MFKSKNYSEVEKNKKSNNGRYASIRKRAAIIGTILICIALAYFVFVSFYRSVLIKYEDDMNAAINYSRMEYINNIEKNNIYVTSNVEYMMDITAFTAFVYEENGYSPAARDELQQDVGSYALYYFFRGHVIPETESVTGYMNPESREIPAPKLSEKQLYELFTEGIMKCEDGSYYSSAPVSNVGYVILKWELDDILKEQSILSSYSDKREISIIRIDEATSIIQDSTDAHLVGTSSDEIIPTEIIKSYELGSPTVGKMADGVRALFIVDKDEDGQLYCAYIKLRELLPEVTRTVSLPIILGWMFLTLILIYSMRFAKNHDESDDQIEYSHIIGKYYIDKTLMHHVVSISMFAIVIITVSMLYVQTLINYSDQNVKATNNLQTLDSMINFNEENRKIMEEDYLSTRSYLVQCISRHYMRYPDKLSQESIVRLNEKLPLTEGIAVVNGDGVIEYDTDGAVGYTLNKDPKSHEYSCWDVINGLVDTTMFSIGDYYRTYVVSRRQDQAGVVMIRQPAVYLDDFNKITTMNDAVSNAYFGTAAKAYVDLSDLKYLYMLESGEPDMIEKNNTLSEQMLQNGYAGIARIDGKRYYINTKVTDEDNYALISAKPLIELFGIYSFYFVFGIIIAFVLQQIVIMNMESNKFNTPVTSEIDVLKPGFLRRSIDAQMMDEKFRKVIRNMFLETCIMIAALLVFDSFYGKTSLLSYLFASQWSKGINIFSVTMILILTAGVIAGGGLLQMVIMFFTKNMGPRGVTVGRLSTSLIKFIVLVVIVINVMLDLGANSGTLLAGAGVFGVAFSLFAQQTLNDFLSGFFIVFEGSFNIGDWITVGDFRGEVVEIGIRTTKVAAGDDIKIINNSELKQVTVMARNGCGARVFIDIAYKEDIDEVLAIIENNRDRYRKELPFMVEGPYIDGVVDLGASGVTIRMWALSSQSKVRAVERGVMKITKNLFDENNIEIPFNQVTIHAADQL